MVLRCSKGLRPTSIARTLVSLADATAICNLGPRALPQHRGSGARSISSGWEPRCFHKEDSPGFAKFDRKRSNKKTPSSCLRNESRKHPRTPPPTRIQQSQEDRAAKESSALRAQSYIFSSAKAQGKTNLYIKICVYVCVYIYMYILYDLRCAARGANRC